MWTQLRGIGSQWTPTPYSWVPSVESRSDRTVRQIMVGQSDAFPAAIEALPAAVDVEILWTGAYDRSHAVGMSDR